MQVLCGLFDQLSLHIPFCSGGGKGGGGGVKDLTGLLFLEGVRWERRGGGDLFEGGGLHFLRKRYTKILNI